MNLDTGIILVFLVIYVRWGDKIFETYQRFCWLQQDIRAIKESLDNQEKRST